MVQVGGRKFPYTKQGKKDATAYAKRTGKRISNKKRTPVKKKRAR